MQVGAVNPNGGSVVDDAELKPTDCIICFETLKNAMMNANCGHSYCDPCIRDWQKRDSSCPKCKKAITTIVESWGMREVVEAELKKNAQAANHGAQKVEQQALPQPAVAKPAPAVSAPALMQSAMPAVAQAPAQTLSIDLVDKLNECLCSRWETIARRCGLNAPDIARLNAKPGHQIKGLLAHLAKMSDGLMTFRNVLVSQGERRSLEMIDFSPSRAMFYSSQVALPHVSVPDSQEAMSPEQTLYSQINSLLVDEWQTFANRCGLSASESAGLMLNPGEELKALLTKLETKPNGLSRFRELLEEKHYSAVLDIIAKNPSRAKFGVQDQALQQKQACSAPSFYSPPPQQTFYQYPQPSQPYQQQQPRNVIQSSGNAQQNKNAEEHFRTRLVFSVNNCLCNYWEQLGRGSGLRAPEVESMRAHPGQEVTHILLHLYSKAGDAGLKAFCKFLSEMEGDATFNEQRNKALAKIAESPCALMFGL